MLLTVLEAHLAPGSELALQTAYTAAASTPMPRGLLRSQLLHDARDATRWRIQTWWANRDALDAMRTSGTPAGILMFRAAGAEATLSVFEVVTELEGAPA